MIMQRSRRIVRRLGTVAAGLYLLVGVVVATHTVRHEMRYYVCDDEQDWQAYSAALDANHGPTAYAFKCRHCGKLGGYSDCH